MPCVALANAGFWDRVGAGFGQYRRTERQQCGSGCDVGEYESHRASWSSAGGLGGRGPPIAPAGALGIPRVDCLPPPPLALARFDSFVGVCLVLHTVRQVGDRIHPIFLEISVPRVRSWTWPPPGGPCPRGDRQARAPHHWCAAPSSGRDADPRASGPVRRGGPADRRSRPHGSTRSRSAR